MNMGASHNCKNPQNAKNAIIIVRDSDNFLSVFIVARYFLWSAALSAQQVVCGLNMFGA